MTRPFRRRVLYIPGFDPVPPRRYRELFRREGAVQAGISGFALAQARRGDATGFGWAAAAQIDGQAVHSEFEVLVWSDIVAASMGHGIAATYGQMLRTAWAYLGSGALWRLMRLRRGPVIAALYPIAVLLAQLAVAAGVAGAAAWAVPWPWAALVFGAALWAGLAGWRRLDGRIFAYYLMHDYAFTAAHGGGWPPALQARLADWRARLAQVLADDWDEVLVVGHSSGAALAVSLLADGPRDPRLALLTLGHVVPMAVALPRADALRADLAVMGGGAAAWVDVTAPGDACCFALCCPVAAAGATASAPLVVSAAFSQSLSPARLRALRGRWFRLHFQYLCAFDRPAAFDYFTVTCGPLTLGQRYGGRAHSPGRIARSVVP